MKNIILLVEDNPDDELLLRRLFRRSHISNEVLTLHDGAEALQWLLPNSGGLRPQRESPEVILLSLKLAKVGGLEVLRRIRADERTKDIPALVLTSSNEEGQRVEKALPGPNGYLCKPVDFAALSQAFNKVGLSWTLVKPSSELEIEA